MCVRIVLPLLAPALVSLGIIVFIWAWGAFLWPLVVVQDRNLYVLSVGLSAYVQPYTRERPWAAPMAASTVAPLPIACLFIFLQRYFIKGLTAAAVKGGTRNRRAFRSAWRPAPPQSRSRRP